jgi:hypothetical protein
MRHRPMRVTDGKEGAENRFCRYEIVALEAAFWIGAATVFGFVAAMIAGIPELTRKAKLKTKRRRQRAESAFNSL